jgi:hypothetical protein
MAASADETDLLQRAEAAIRDGEARRDNPQQARLSFLEAALLFETLHKQGIQNADLFRNEGNAYLLAGDLPRAILAYRRGLRYAPGERVLQANLHYAREQVDYPSGDGFGRPPIDHWPPWSPRLSLGALLALALVAYTASLVALTRWVLTRRGVLLVISIGLIALAIAPLVAVIYEAWQLRRERANPVVLIAANHVQLRNGDGLAYSARYDGKTLNRGVEARLLNERGDWLQIELAGGEMGWVRRVDVLSEPP